MNKKHFNIYTLICVIGFGIIIFGIVLTVIPLFNFDGRTFKLIPALISGLLLPLIGIITIVGTIIASTIKKSNDEIEDISNKVKKEMGNIKAKSQSATNTCAYCGCKCKKEDNVCPNCGAKIK